MRAFLYIKSPTRDLIKFRELEIAEPVHVLLLPLPPRWYTIQTGDISAQCPEGRVSRFERRAISAISGEAMYVLTDETK